MKTFKTRDLLTFIISVIFSVALMFAFTEIPKLLDNLLQQNIGFPGADPGSSELAAYQMELFISATGLRWIGYASITLIIVLIVIGFATKKSGIAIGGAMISFLPVFGGFAAGMFYLAGLGVLRSSLLPLIDISPDLIKLGSIIYLPYWLLIRFFFIFHVFAHRLLVWFFMSFGALVFTWSVFTWMQARIIGKNIATGFLYKYSRHPQYLGWIIWSYGYFIFTCALNQSKKSWWIDPSLSWLIMTMIIIAVSMLEELRMKEKYGSKYEEYRAKTPFMFPIPGWLKKILKFPGTLLLRKSHPTKSSEIVLIVTTYTILLMILSVPFIHVKTYGYPEFINKSKPEKYSISQIVDKIKNEPERRNMAVFFSYLKPYGEDAFDALTSFMRDSDPVKREFASNLLGEIHNSKSEKALLTALGDSISRVNSNILFALGNLGMESSAGPILEFVKKPGPLVANKNAVITSLGLIGSMEAWDYLLSNINDTVWFYKTASLQALCRINTEMALPYVYEALLDDNYFVRRTAVAILLDKKPDNAIPYLEKVTDDEDYETRFYAKQAIRLINKKNGHR